MKPELNVAYYISELLYKHDCVIVPGFGGFVSTYTPARIHPGQHSFSPPSKQILFNKHLQQNDGLLAQAISSALSCNFDDVMVDITKFADDINLKLKLGKTVELNNLGILSLDPSKNICFETSDEVNFLIGSFGLSTFQSMPIIREEDAEKRKPIERRDRTNAVGTSEVKPIRKRIRRVALACAVILPILAAAFWFTSQKTDALAGFGMFGKKEISKFNLVKWYVNESKESLNVPSAIVADSNGIAKISFTSDSPEIIVDVNKIIPDTTAVKSEMWTNNSNSDKKGYFIIGGCFAVQENADRFIKLLKEKGYQPQVIDKVRSRLTRVGIACFKSKDEAIQYIARLNSDVPGAWILKM